MKKILSLIGILTASVFIYGCATNSTIAPNGVYSGDAFLYNADLAVVTTFNDLDSFLILETKNQDYFKTNAPIIFTAANDIRKYTPSALNDISKAREFYINYSKNTNTVLVTQAQVGLTSAITELQNQTTNLNPQITSTSDFTNTVNSLSTNNISSVLTQ